MAARRGRPACDVCPAVLIVVNGLDHHRVTTGRPEWLAEVGRGKNAHWLVLEESVQPGHLRLAQLECHQHLGLVPHDGLPHGILRLQLEELNLLPLVIIEERVQRPLNDSVHHCTAPSKHRGQCVKHRVPRDNLIGSHAEPAKRVDD